MNPKFLKLIIATVLFVLLHQIVEGGTKPSVYGRVLLQKSTGRSALSGVAVRLISLDNPKAYPRVSYTDARGNFAFYNVSKGTYEIQILTGNPAVQQQNQSPPRIIEHRNIELVRKSQKLADIIITKKGF